MLSLAEMQALVEGKEDLANSWELMRKHKGLLTEREGDLDKREAALEATTTELDHRQAELTEQELKTRRGEAAPQYASVICCVAVHCGSLSRGWIPFILASLSTNGSVATLATEHQRRRKQFVASVQNSLSG